MKNYLKITFLLFAGLLYAQEEDIKEESVVVEFSFNPNLSDAFKLKSFPKALDSVPRKELEYNVTPTKVQSDFKPLIKKAKYASTAFDQKEVFDNYLYLAGGLYGNTELETLIGTRNYDEWNYGAYVSGMYSNNGIEEDRVDNNQLNTLVDLFVSRTYDTSIFRLDAAYNRNQVHYYGLPNVDFSSLGVNLNTLDTEQVYNAVELKGDWKFQETLFSGLTPSLTFFSDAFKSTEIDFTTQILLKPVIAEKAFSAKVNFQYLSGDFNSRANLVDGNSSYRFINLGVGAFRAYTQDKLSIVLGADIFLNSDSEVGETNFYFMPNLQLNYAVVENIMTLKTGVTGDFSQNSYYSLTQSNPFVLPSLQLKATAKPIEMSLGLDGVLSSSFSYEIGAAYTVEKNKLLFRNTPQSSDFTTAQAYELGNSFSALYDDVNTFTLSSLVGVALSKELKVDFVGAFNMYNTNTEQEAWNLPGYEFGVISAYAVNKWKIGFDINLIGERKDITVDGAGVETPVSLSAYADANLNLAYQFNNRFSAHINSYNLFGNNYDRYVNYEVQGFQLVGGISYKF